jgi:hypothetical protein
MVSSSASGPILPSRRTLASGPRSPPSHRYSAAGHGGAMPGGRHGPVGADRTAHCGQGGRHGPAGVAHAPLVGHAAGAVAVTSPASIMHAAVSPLPGVVSSVQTVGITVAAAGVAALSVTLSVEACRTAGALGAARAWDGAATAKGSRCGARGATRHEQRTQIARPIMTMRNQCGQGMVSTVGVDLFIVARPTGWLGLVSS